MRHRYHWRHTMRQARGPWCSWMRSISSAQVASDAVCASRHVHARDGRRCVMYLRCAFPPPVEMRGVEGREVAVAYCRARRASISPGARRVTDGRTYPYFALWNTVRFSGPQWWSIFSRQPGEPTTILTRNCASAESERRRRSAGIGQAAICLGVRVDVLVSWEINVAAVEGCHALPRSVRRAGAPAVEIRRSLPDNCADDRRGTGRRRTCEPAPL
jgi:hypothetical protein